MKRDEMNSDKTELGDWQLRKDIGHLKEDIILTGEIWKIYKTHVIKLLENNKIKEPMAMSVQDRVVFLSGHWGQFSKYWEGLKLPQFTLQSIQKQEEEFDCFSKKLTELHDLIQVSAYPYWFDRCYQFIKTILIKLYNCLFAGRHHSSAYTNGPAYASCIYHGRQGVLFYRQPTVASYMLKKHNYFIYQEKLEHHTGLLKKDLATLENWGKAFQLDNATLKNS